MRAYSGLLKKSIGFKEPSMFYERASCHAVSTFSINYRMLILQ